MTSLRICSARNIGLVAGGTGPQLSLGFSHKQGGKNAHPRGGALWKTKKNSKKKMRNPGHVKNSGEVGTGVCVLRALGGRHCALRGVQRDTNHHRSEDFECPLVSWGSLKSENRPRKERGERGERKT
jgi:hypothetical protein